jgi:hypothetical protein
MTDISMGAPEAHPVARNQRLHVTSLPHIPTSHLHDQHRFTLGVISALLPRPESHSP